MTRVMYRVLLLLWIPLVFSIAHAAAEGYFMFPIKPGQPASITGNMGELRTNHFHGGLDVRTDYQTGLNVYACADGFVRRVEVSSHGYGYMVHLQHPNGLVTVYAHLERFAEPIRKFIQAEQLKREQFEVEAFPEAGQIRFKKGDVIGLSGNSGSSGGPHLHFEIRDTNDLVLNPLNFHFDEITDKLNPFFAGLAFETLDMPSRVNGLFGRVQVPIRKEGNIYRGLKTVYLDGPVGVQIFARDRINNGSQHTGISCIELKLDGKDIFHHNLENFAFEHTGHINAHIDYAHFRQTGERYQRLYRSDGNLIYKARYAKERGIIEINDSLEHQLEVTIYDAYQNSAILMVTVKKGSEALAGFSSKRLNKILPDYSVYGNLFELTGPANTDTCRLLTPNKAVVLGPEWINASKSGFLYDLRRGLPQAFEFEGREQMDLPFVKTIPSGRSINLRTPIGLLHFTSNSLFDTCYLSLQATTDGREMVIGREEEPLKSSISLRCHPTLPSTRRRENYAPYLLSSGKLKYLNSKWFGDQLLLETKYFGRVRVLADSMPPTARIIQSSPAGFRALISDNLSGIKQFDAYAEGRWLLLHYDHKRNLIWSENDTYKVETGQTITLRVTDNCGNVREVTTRV